MAYQTTLSSKKISTVMLGLFVVVSSQVEAITEAKVSGSKQIKPQNQVRYSTSLEVFHSMPNVNLSTVRRTLAIPDVEFDKRMTDSKEDSRIEPIQIAVGTDDDKIIELAGKISKPGKKVSLANFIREHIDLSESIPGTSLKLVTLTPESLTWISRPELDEMFAKDHVELTVKTANLKKDKTALNKFVTELTPYLLTSTISEIRKRISLGRDLSVDQLLLPKFAKNIVKHHSIFKGPNCFHAALAFQNSDYPKSSQVNVREEVGYHRSMINYDELWRIVQSDFYEVDPKKSPVKYGDMILFFDVPKEAHSAVDFRTLRHAATYLMGGYVFAKGSKSANSPYVVRPLSEEWSTWTKFSENLGAKVYRRNLQMIKKASLWNSNDWLY